MPTIKQTCLAVFVIIMSIMMAFAIKSCTVAALEVSDRAYEGELAFIESYKAELNKEGE